MERSGFDHVDDIDPAPEATDITLLPFVLYDCDTPATRRAIAHVPVVLPDDWLAALLFAHTRPGQFSTTDAAGRWQAVAHGLMQAAVTQLRRDLADVRARAARDIDAELRWEECREQVRRHLCPATEPDDTRRTSTRDGSAPVTRLRLVAPPDAVPD
jgi:GAF domain-containing protein